MDNVLMGAINSGLAYDRMFKILLSQTRQAVLQGMTN